ncbi:MAG: cytochrome c oxidase subunit 3 [Planctomycetota bacterium]|jgi:cytochrome c oxidase subunit 3
MTAIDTHGPAEHGHDHDHDHPEFLAHHWESPQQQFEAGKLGMWLFLATELLLFGGLFCAYAVFRNLHPEIFAYGSQFLDTRWGAINTVVLILSSLTMAMAVTAAQLGKRGALITLLSLTFLGGAGFMVIKAVEYSHKFHENLVWGVGFYEEPDHGDEADHAEEAADVMVGDAGRGRPLFLATCRSCHGAAGEGIPGQGKDQRGSAFIAGKNDEELVEFIKAGRMPFDPMNTTGIQMPPKGGNPLLTDAQLLDIVAYIRTFKAPEEGAATEVVAAVPEDEEFVIPHSSIPDAPSGPPGLSLAHPVVDFGDDAPATPHHSVDPKRPANAHIFFGIYFSMTGLHGIHVLVGMIVIGWLIWKAARRQFSAEYFTPVDLGGLYWHIVDLIWIFLFPLFYLI